MVHTPKNNNIILNLQPGTYYLKVTPITNEKTNPQPSQTIVVKVDSKGFVASNDIKKRYPNKKRDVNTDDSIKIVMKNKNDDDDDNDESDDDDDDYDDESDDDSKSVASTKAPGALGHPLLNKNTKISFQELEDYLQLDRVGKTSSDSKSKSETTTEQVDDDDDDDDDN